jgi:phage shock protein E
MIFVDVREPAEFAASHVQNALNIPPSSIMAGAPELKGVPKNTPLVLYCRSGRRSQNAMHYLRAQGYNNLTNGINEHYVRSNFANMLN